MHLKNIILLANQWEPSTKIQHAANVYRKQFGDDVLVNEDINVLLEKIIHFLIMIYLLGDFHMGFLLQTHLQDQRIRGTKGNL